MIGQPLWPKVHIDQRAALRFPYGCPATVTAGARSEQGTVVNLSVWGCALRSRMPVTRGHRVALALSPPGEDVPLVLDLARVRWSRAGMIGIEFLNMAASARARLRRRLLALREKRVSA